jgi:hypothetical protein
MDSGTVYKLARARDPSAAVASAAAAIGLPTAIVKLALPTSLLGRTGVRTARRQLLRRPTRVAAGAAGATGPSKSWTPFPAKSESWTPFPAKKPGVGSRIAKNWWTLPAAGAGVYGLGSMVGAFGGGDEGMEPGYGVPTAGPTPQEQRYQRMMALAQQYGY